jgi:hypothetical protein
MVASVLLVAIVTTPIVAQTTEASSESITGRVVDENARPVADAEVLLYRVSASGERNTPKTAETATREDGTFAFEALSKGLYSLVVKAPGFVFHDDNPSYGRGANVTLRVAKGGVITGTVTGPDGGPLVGLEVRAKDVPDENDRKANDDGYEQYKYGSALTDDRGVYRIYGLDVGSYLVVAGGASSRASTNAMPSVYYRDALTYYPSATRSDSPKVAVRLGDEVGGIDIRYKAERGYDVSGNVRAIGGFHSTWVRVTLKRSLGEAIEDESTVSAYGDASFEFRGVPSGDYLLVARQFVDGSMDEVAVSSPRRVEVRDANVRLLELVLPAFRPLASIAGRVVVEPVAPNEVPKSCPVPVASVANTLRISLWPDSQTAAGVSRPSRETRSKESGEFGFPFLKSGRYRPIVDHLSSGTYTVAVELAPVRSNHAVDVARAGLDLAPGSKVEGLIVRIASGAASVSGRVAHASDGSALPVDVHVVLVPDDVGDVVRYVEAPVEDGRFALTNLAPGIYRIAIFETASDDRLRIHWDEAKRKALAIEVRGRGTKLELGACQSVSDLVLVFDPSDMKAEPRENKP